MNGIRVYDWHKSIDIKFPTFTYNGGFDIATEMRHHELVYDIIKDMITDGVKKSIVYKCNYYRNICNFIDNIKLFPVTVFPYLNDGTKFSEITKKDSSDFFSMEIEKNKYRILILDKSQPSKTDNLYQLMRNRGRSMNAEDLAVYIGIEPVENEQNATELNLWNEYNKVFTRSQEELAFENQVKKDGIEYAGKRIAMLVNEKIPNSKLAKRFVFIVLSGAEIGDTYARNFALNSGFKEPECSGSIYDTSWGDESELNHLSNLQMFVKNFTLRLSDRDLMMKLLLSIVDEIMKIWKLGKYNSASASPIMNLSTDDIDYQKLSQVLAELEKLKQDEKTIEVLQLSAAGLPISALDRGRVDKVHKLMHKISELTGQTLEELFDKGGLQRIMEDYINTNSEDEAPPF